MTISKQALAVLGVSVAFLHIALFVGTSYLMHTQGASMPATIAKMDQIEYMQLAYTMLDHGRFALSADVPPEIFRTPSYPALIAFVNAFSGQRYWSIFVSHGILLGLLAIIVTLIAAELGLSRRASLLAGILMGVSSGSVLLSITGTGSDILYTTLYAFAAYMALRTSLYTLERRGILIGLLLGLATLTRPVGILASLPILLGFAFLHTSERRRTVPATVCALAAWAIVLAPWYARNTVVAGTPLLSTVSTFNITYYNIPMNETFWRGVGEDASQEAVLTAIGAPNPESMRGVTYLHAMQTYDVAYLKSHLWEYGMFHLYRTIPFFAMSGFNVANAIISHEAPGLRLPLFPTEGDNLTRHVAAHEWSAAARALGTYWFTTLERLSWLLAIGLAFLAPFVAYGVRRRILILFALIIATNIILISPVTQARYRVPVEPFIWTAAVYTGAALWKRHRAHNAA